MPSITVDYSVMPNGIKESIVLNRQEPGVTAFSYMLSAQGLQAFLNEDKSIDFYKAESGTKESSEVSDTSSKASASSSDTFLPDDSSSSECAATQSAEESESATAGEAASFASSEVSSGPETTASSDEKIENDTDTVSPTEPASPKKPDGEPVFHMPAPFMFDAKMAYTVSIEVSLTATDGGWLLTYAPNAEWLAAKERVFPVTVDPTVETTRSYYNIYDTYVQTDSSSNYGTSTALCIGHTSGSIYQKTFVRIGSLATIPEGSIVTGAAFNMYRNSSYTTSAEFRTGIYKITSSWSETGLNCTNVPGYDSAVLDWAVHNSSTSGYVGWDITGLVSDWYSGTATNYGVMVAMHDVSSNVTAQQAFYSCDNTSQTDKMPYIVIEYANQTGSAAQSARQIDVGRAGTVSINDFTGGLMIDRHDIGVDGNVMPVDIRMIYNTAERNKAIIGTIASCSDFGAGFRSNYSQMLKYYSNGQPKPYFEYTTEDGSVIYFERAIDSGYSGQTDRTAIFTTEDQRGYMLYAPAISDTDFAPNTSAAYVLDSSGRKYFFDTLNRLVKIVGNMPQTADVTRDSAPVSGNCEPGVIKINYTTTGGHDNTLQIDNIIDGAGRKYKFNYNDSYKLTSIQYLGTGATALQTVTYSINTSTGVLNSVTYPGSRTVYYAWSNNLPTEVKNSDNYKVNFTYTGTQYRVYTIREYGTDGTLGQSVNVTYGKYQTTYTDNLTGDKEILQFDSRGNTICVQDGKGNAAFGKYEEAPESSKQPNRLVFSSGLQRTSVNLIKNPIAATSSDWSGTVSRVSDQKKYGTYSFKLTAANSYLSQSVSLTASKTYTLSAWVKTDSIASGGSAAVSVSGTGITTTKAATALAGTNDWTRIYAVFTTGPSATSATVRLSLDGAAGNVWFDGIQLEYGSVMRRFTLVSNGGFENGLVTWNSFISSVGSAPTYSATNGRYNYVSSTASTLPAGSNYAILYGDPRYANSVYQDIPVSGEQDDKYTFGAWVKANSVALKDDRAAGVKLEFLSGGSVIAGSAVILTINPYVIDWQYLMGEAAAPAAYTSVRITMRYSLQSNSAWFDGLQVYAEPFGEIISDEGNPDPEYDNPTTDKSKTTEDDYGRLVETVSSEGVGNTTNYDAYNNPLVERITNGRVSIETINAYTADGNYLASSKDPLGKTMTYIFNTELGRLNSITDPRNSTTTYGYDTMGLMSSISQLSSGGTLSNAYGYDSGDRLNSITRNGFAYNFTYDPFGALTNIKVGSSRNLITYNYNTPANGYTLASAAYGNGQTVSYRYDDNQFFAGVSFGGNERYTYLADDDGQLYAIIDNASGLRTEYSLDSAGKSVTIKTGSNFLTQKYWNTGDVLTEILGSVTRLTNYKLDKDGRNNGVWWTTGGTDSRQETYWDDLGRTTGGTLYRQTGENVTYLLNTTYSYNDVPGYKTSQQVYALNLRGPEYNKLLTYEYDANGNISKADDVQYTYDAAGQLTQVVDPAYGTSTYTYNTGGNITSVTSSGTTKTYTYGDSVWKDLLTNYNGTSISYDTVGNPLNWHSGITSMTWEMGRELAGLTKNGVSHSFTYNEDGLRTSKTIGSATTRYYWADGKLTAQDDGTNFIYFRYDSDGNLVAFELNGEEYYYVKNLQGDIIAILDSGGACVVEYEYNAWGALLSTTGSLASTIGQVNPFRYRGYYYDVETGLFYVGSRYYDPQTGRFINADSVVAGVGGDIRGYNLFSYCFNNPVNMSDPSGHWPQWLKNVGNAIKSAATAVANFFSPNTNTISGSFQEGPFIGSGSLTAGYSEIMIRGQGDKKAIPKSGEPSVTVGAFAKVSGGNAGGKVGIGNKDVALSVKGVGDVLTAQAQAGLKYQDGLGLTAKAKAAVVSGRATLHFQLFGWQVEFGVTGDALSAGAEATIGIFDGGFEAKANASLGVGGGFVFRVQPG